MSEQPASQTIERAAPTDVTVLKTCPLQYAFSKSGKKRVASRPRSPAARLGGIAHRALELMVMDGSLFHADVEQSIENAWNTELERDHKAHASAKGAERWGPPESWNNYHLVRAQLHVGASNLKAILEPVAADAEYLVEAPLKDPDTILWGIPDLVVRSAELHVLIDYKTGSVRGPDMKVRDSYETQMHIYAYLESKSAGNWPGQSLILSFQDGVVDVDSGPANSMPYVEDALRRVTAYNRGTPGTPPASPSPDACRFCRFIPRCPPFWQAAAELASEGLAAVRGSITRVASTPLGGYSIRIQPFEDSPFQEEVTIRRIDPTTHTVVGDIHVGDSVCVTHLYEVTDRETNYSEWRLGRFGELFLLQE